MIRMCADFKRLIEKVQSYLYECTMVAPPVKFELRVSEEAPPNWPLGIVCIARHFINGIALVGTRSHYNRYSLQDSSCIGGTPNLLTYELQELPRELSTIARFSSGKPISVPSDIVTVEQSHSCHGP